MKVLEPTPDQASLATESAAALVDSTQGGVVGPGAVVTPASPDSLIREDARTDGSLLLAAPDITR